MFVKGTRLHLLTYCSSWKYVFPEVQLETRIILAGTVYAYLCVNSEKQSTLIPHSCTKFSDFKAQLLEVLIQDKIQ